MKTLKQPILFFIGVLWIVALMMVPIGAVAQPLCTAPDNGGGTADLPAACPYRATSGHWMIIDGLPAGTTIEIDAVMTILPGVGRMFDGSGEWDSCKARMMLTLHGTGALAGLNRFAEIPMATLLMHHNPRTPGMAIQSFDSDLNQLFGMLPIGDPDFDLLRITGGSGYSMPSPGHTTLTQSGGGWNVDSFFDITYRIDFVGRSGGPLAGRSGSTTGTIRMAQQGLTGTTLPIDSLPPAGQYDSRRDSVTVFANGLMIRNIKHHQFTNDAPPPPAPGMQQVYTFGSLVEFEVSTNGGSNWSQANAPGNTAVLVRASQFDPPTRYFDTEMLSLSISGGTLPAGVHIRESPTKQSMGRTSITNVPTGYTIDSFFDIFTEVSLDGGANWSPSQSYARMILGPPKGPPTTGNICGMKYEDRNGNGVKDPGEPGISGWTIILFDGVSTQTTVTDLLGNYCFNDLPAGTYQVKEAPQAGWVQSGGLLSYTVIVGAGQTVTGIDFGNYRPPGIYGYKYNDLNGNGVRDPGEPGIQGWTICLFPKTTPGPEHTLASGTATVDFGNGPVQLDLMGSTLERTAPVGPPSEPIPIEMLAMELRSVAPVQLADSFFDVFFDITPSPPTTCPPSMRSLGMRAPGGNWAVDSFFDITYRIDLSPPGLMPASSHVMMQPMHMMGVPGQTNSLRGNNGQMKDCQTGQPTAVVQLLTITHGNPVSPSNPYYVRTDSSGKYCFMNIPPGMYNIREVPRQGWTQTTPDPTPITVESGETVGGVDFGNHDIEDPVIIPTWTWDDKQNENLDGPYGVQVRVTENSLVIDPNQTPGTSIDSFFDVFLEVSLDGGTNWNSKRMESNSFFDVFAKAGGGQFWEYADVPPSGYSPGTDMMARVRAVDATGNTTVTPIGNITLVPPRPVIKPLWLAPFKLQFDYERYWYGGKASNSWCGPTAVSSCLQRLGVPNLPTLKDDLVKALAREMNTDNIAKNAVGKGSGNPGRGTDDNTTTNAAGNVHNGFVSGINKFLTNIGQRNKYTVKVWDGDTPPTSFVGADAVNGQYPTYADYERELHNGEDVLIGMTYPNGGGHWVTGVGQIDGVPPTIIVMDPATGKLARIKWNGNQGKYNGGNVTIDIMVSISPKGNLTATPLDRPTHLVAAGSTYTPKLRVRNTHPFHIPKNVVVHCTIPGMGYSSDRTIPSVGADSFFDVFFDVFVAPPYAPNSFFDIFYEIEYSDDNPPDNSAMTMMELVPGTRYRTATMEQWAANPKPIKCKPDKVDFKFNLIVQGIPGSNVAASILEIKFNIPVDRIKIYDSKNKVDTACNSVVIDPKRVLWKIDFNCPVDPSVLPGQEIQIDGRGLKPKLIAFTYRWLDKAGNIIAKGSSKTPIDPRDIIKKNQLLLPMPNLANVVYQIYEQQVLPPDTGILIGVARPESAKVEGYLAMKKPGDVMKTLNYKGQPHTGDPREFDVFLTGKRILKKQTSLAPNKYNNRLLAEAIALCLNIKAGEAAEKFPGLFGDLVIDLPPDSVPTQWRDCYDLQIRSLGRLTVNDFAMMLKRWFTDRRWWGPMPKTQPPICDSTNHRQMLMWLTQMLNGAFAGQLDTLSWNCGKIRMAGVKDLTQVPWLRYDPSIPPTIEHYDWVANWTPSHYALAQNYPNPFNPTTMIEFELPDEAFVTLKVYNTLGQEVATLIDNELFDSGTEQFEFDASALPSGVYFYRLMAKGVGDQESGTAGQPFIGMKKMVLIR